VKFRSRQTGSADFIRSVAVVRLAVFKLQHAWQGLTPWVAGTWCFPSLVLTAHSKVFSASPKPRQTMSSYAFESEPVTWTLTCSLSLPST
jgi:hypothetical protein